MANHCLHPVPVCRIHFYRFLIADMTSPSVALTGSIVALITPMLEDGSVDYPSLRKLIDWHVAEGTNCIGVVGTTGESPTVNVEEHCEIIRVAVEQAAGRVSIMAGCGANSTHEAIELAKYAKKVGADSQLQVVPYYNKPTQEGQYQHFKAIAEATGRPAHGSVQRARPLGCGHAA
jgi:4-hydroxy-tetrahydrodipicolinate synthase